MSVNTPQTGVRATLAADGVAGGAIAGLLLAEAVAYSSVAGLPPQAGVVGVLCGLVVYGLLGTSRSAIVAATSSSAAVLASAVVTLAPHDAATRASFAAALVLASGALFVIGAAARLGHITQFIAKPVLRGFAFGLACVIALRQFAIVVGVHPTTHDAIPYAWALFSHAASFNGWGLAIGVGTYAVLVLCRRGSHVPGALVAMVAGIALASVVPLADHGVALVGSIEVQFDRPLIPMLDRTEWLRIGELAVALAMILFAESSGAIRTIALQHGDPIAPNRELIALGVANIASGLFQGTPVGAGFSASMANEAAGARTRAAGWIAAALIAIAVWALLPWIARTPEPVLAAIVIHAVSHALDVRALMPYFRWRRDRTVLVAAVIAVFALGVLHGLLVAIAVSVFMLLRDLAAPRVSVLGRYAGGHDYLDRAKHPDVEQVPGLLILRPDAPLLFANADRMLALAMQRLDAAPAAHTLILSLEESADLDASALEALDEFVGALQRRSVRLVLARVKDHVRSLIARAELPRLSTSIVVGYSVDDAVRDALDHDAAALPAATTDRPVHPSA